LTGLKKNQDLSIEQMRGKIEFLYDKISVSRQCELLGLSRATLYYQSRGINEYNLKIMRLIDEQYLNTPFYGSRRMTALLQRKGYDVNRKRIRRLMVLMGIQAIYPGPNLSKACKEHEIYPYLLRELDINRPNQVWCSDITYIRLKSGFIYLVAIMDWFSRKVLSWEVSITLESDFCIRALERALMKYGKPEIFNTDQGVQFTCRNFIKVLKSQDIKISMDGKGRALDNIFIERLWRSLKYEEVYLKDYESVKVAVVNLRQYFDFYNHERLHQSLDYQTPEEVYISSINEQVEERKRA
jgi:putative transposase